jgi:ankyrin repeat protein
VQEFLENGGENSDVASWDIEGYTPLHVAVQRGYAKIAEFLIERGAGLDDVDAIGMTPLHWAVIRGHAGMVQKLAESGADVEAAKGGVTPLYLADTLEIAKVPLPFFPAPLLTFSFCVELIFLLH